MKNIKLLCLPVFLTLILFSCKDEVTKYDRPAWLAGKVYSVILEHSDSLSTFATCVKLIGYDKVLDVSGSYTVFAPSNEAFESFLSANPKYTSVEDIPLRELERIVKFHIIKNPWSKAQLRSLDNYGWIDTLASSNNTPEGFKRQTILLDDNVKYGVSKTRFGTDLKEIIVDTLDTNFRRIVNTDSRKYAPIFFSEYLRINGLSSSDYEFYFDRPFDGGDNIYFAGAKVVSNEIFAENGFIYIVDRVTEPLKNVSQILSAKDGTEQYTNFLNVLNYFPIFSYNQEKTNLQTGADLGYVVDSLFDLTYNLTFNFNQEKTLNAGRDGTVRYQRGMMAPTNQAFQQFINEYLKIPDGWGSIKDAPVVIQSIIAKTYMSEDAIYPVDFEKGFYNGVRDLVTLDRTNIVHKEFGSNSTFIGLNNAIIPRAFASVAKPVFLKRGFQKVMYAINHTGLLNALNRPNENYMFFVESDMNTSQDSSLIQLSPRGNLFAAFERDNGGDGAIAYLLSTLDLRTLLLNHIAKGQPDGLARKEFIPNLAGNFIIINNETGEVSGTSKTTNGFRGTEFAPNFPVTLSQSSDNGTTYEIENWFTFNNVTLFQKLSSSYPRWHALLKKAKFVNEAFQTYSFISANEFYTILVPTDEAITNAGLDAMPFDQLRKVLLLHVIQGEMIFTDGKKPSQYYETARVDEKSNEFTTIYTNLFINTGINRISIPDKNGTDYVEIVENGVTTNIITGVSINSGSGSAFPSTYSNGIVHQINRVLKIEELETK